MIRALAHVFLAAGMAAAGLVPAIAQQAPEAQERARIGAERVRAQAVLDSELAACYQRFVVTSCVEDARRRHRLAVADLRRQETALNDQQRTRDAADQVRRLDERQRMRSGEDERLASSESASQAERDRRSASKAADRQVGESRASARARSQLPAPPSPGAAETRAARNATRATDEATREAQANERRRKRKAATQRRAKPPAMPLPVPP